MKPYFKVKAATTTIDITDSHYYMPMSSFDMECIELKLRGIDPIQLVAIAITLKDFNIIKRGFPTMPEYIQHELFIEGVLIHYDESYKQKWSLQKPESEYEEYQQA